MLIDLTRERSDFGAQSGCVIQRPWALRLIRDTVVQIFDRRCLQQPRGNIIAQLASWPMHIYGVHV